MDLKTDQIRAIIYYEWKQTKNAIKIHEKINDVLGDNTVGYSTITKWICEFKRGRESLEGEHSGGQKQTMTTPENAVIVEDIIRADPSITYHELEERTGIPRTSLQRICERQLGVRKRLCRFVPHRLTNDQKDLRVEICRKNLNLWKKGRSNVIDKIVTGDEVYLYYYEPKLSRESKIFVFEDEVPPDVVKKEKTIRKVLYAVFFNTSGLVEAVKLEGQRSVTALWYTTKCLPRVFERCNKSGLMLHHDNAPSHSAFLTTNFLAKNKVKIVPHPPYSPDLAMCDFWLFSGLKHFLRGKVFSSEGEIDCVVNEYFESIPKEAWASAFEMWRTRMIRCIDAQGDYIV
jgi:[histone H3]-lysine36 N-dimethyltransferase SETMAR